MASPIALIAAQLKCIMSDIDEGCHYIDYLSEFAKIADHIDTFDQAHPIHDVWAPLAQVLANDQSDATTVNAEMSQVYQCLAYRYRG